MPRLMSTVTPMSPSEVPTDPAVPHHRRSREDLEALAKNFVATPVEEVPPPAKPRMRLALAAAGAVFLGVLVVVLWPRGEEAARPAQVDTARAAAEAEQWRQRFEAERERKRQELKAGSDYMAKMAAADSALIKEMAGRAAQLTAEPEAPVEPAPAPAQKRRAPEPTPKEAEPTPRTTTQTATAAPAPAPAPAPTPAAVQPAAVQPAAAQPAAPAPAEKTAPAAEPATVAAAPTCKQHVSQLSASGRLTYADVARMKGARTDGRGHVFTPPVVLDDGRRVIFEVMPDGCMKWRRA